ncbi:MAG TPA: hypothetical protein VE664_06115 [Actinomycetes bacterium]|nr:hypothetical protein [Actinomycetes bacterium]
MASHTGRRPDQRRGAEPRRPAEPRRGTEVRRSAQDYERELRRRELAIGRSLTGVLPADRPARVRELVEARRVMSGATRDLERLVRQLRNDLERYSAHRSHSQREVLAYEAVAGEIEEVLLRWEARREQLSTTIDRANRRQGRQGARQDRAGAAGHGRGQGRPGATQSRQGTGEAQGQGQGRQGRRDHRRQGGGRRGGSGNRSSGGAGRPDPPRAG